MTNDLKLDVSSTEGIVQAYVISHSHLVGLSDFCQIHGTKCLLGKFAMPITMLDQTASRKGGCLVEWCNTDITDFSH